MKKDTLDKVLDIIYNSTELDVVEKVKVLKEIEEKLTEPVKVKTNKTR